MKSSVARNELSALLSRREEVAVLDVRSFRLFNSGHILRSIALPVDWIESRVARLLPRKSIPIILVDEDGSLTPRAAEKLDGLGYTDVRQLKDGLNGWRTAGKPIISGQHAISKALGEYVERRYHTPRLTPQELQRRRDSGDDIIVIDTRPAEEFGYVAIPDSIAAPGVEILYRFDEIVHSPDTTVVVTCAGRTRGILGAQALLNAGIPNPIYSLENGTSGWEFAGFEPLRGASDYAPPPRLGKLGTARDRAARIEGRTGVLRISPAELDAFRSEEDTRSLYLFDIRTAEEFRAGHVPGALSVPGGQLVQTTDLFIGAQYARIVVIDGEDGVRGALTASWLVQMDVGEVFLFAASPGAASELGDEPLRQPELSIARYVGHEEIADRIVDGSLTVVDFASVLSAQSSRRVVPGSWYATWASIPESVDGMPGDGDILFLSEDGDEAAFAANEISSSGRRELLVFKGGKIAWEEAELPLVDEEHPHSLAPEGPPNAQRTIEQRKAFFDDYVAWGDVIVEQIEADGTLAFKALV